MDQCNKTTGACEYPAKTCTDDGDKCTVEACSLVSGKCETTPLDCNDKDACTTDSCDKTKGCVHGTVNCDDGNACTTDSCNAYDGCKHESIPGCN